MSIESTLEGWLAAFPEFLPRLISAEDNHINLPYSVQTILLKMGTFNQRLFMRQEN